MNRAANSKGRWGSALLLGLIALGGCGGDDNPAASDSTSTEVIAPFTHLQVVEPGDDPLRAHRPETVDCNPLTGWYIESVSADSNVLEANTGVCNYLALQEPAATSAAPGDVLFTELSYFDLTAPSPSEAHVALSVDDLVIWETTIPIPSDADVRELEIPLTVPVAEGELIRIHLHNHGQNSWNLSPILVRRRARR